MHHQFSESFVIFFELHSSQLISIHPLLCFTPYSCFISGEGRGKQGKQGNSLADDASNAPVKKGKKAIGRL
jgi:hypothetical protein